MSDGRPRNYYSLNLTEGRIFIIFIAFIILLVLVIFGFLILVSNNKKSEDINLQVENEDFKNIESSDFVFYSDLSGEPETEINIELTDTEDNKSKINSVKKEKNTLDEPFKLEVKEKEKEEIPITEKRTNENIVKLDDSEVLYSSKFDDKVEIKKTSTTKTYTQPVTTKKSSTTSVASNRRYIVQIGSYLSQDIANDIHSYYETQGYPTYIKTKKSDGKTYYRLRVGPFKEKDRAEKYMASLKDSKYGKNCYISIVYL